MRKESSEGEQKIIIINLHKFLLPTLDTRTYAATDSLSANAHENSLLQIDF